MSTDTRIVPRHQERLVSMFVRIINGETMLDMLLGGAELAAIVKRRPVSVVRLQKQGRVAILPG